MGPTNDINKHIIIKERLMNGRRKWAVLGCAVLIVAMASPAMAQNIDAKEYRLDNGMQILMVERHEAPTIMGAIFAHVGSANETTGITGISHLFEHMMFKGTETIGTKDIKRDREVMAQLDSLRELMRGEQRIMREQYRRGLITDMNDPEAKTERFKEIDAVFDSLILEQRELIIKDQLDEIYSKNGGFFLNAFTAEDMTGYFIRLPKNKIELFMWLESDRFSHPVFREFYSERDVVREERRMRIESTPTGLLEEDFRSMFWKSNSYHWDVIGWPSDVENITREQANNYFATYYAPNNLTMVLVGDFKPDKMIKMVRKYFERIPRGATEPPDVTTLEESQYAEKKMIGEAETNPTAEIWYHTVAWKNADSYALEVLAGILNGKTGRLYKKLVDELNIADGSGGGGGYGGMGSGLKVSAAQNSNKYAGYFSISAEGKCETPPEKLEAAIYDVLADLQTNPVPEKELQKVKNQYVVDNIRFMDIMSGIGILFYLGSNAADGDWTEVNDGPAKVQAVTAEDVMRVAKTYFDPMQRNVLLINTKKVCGPEGEETAPQDPQFQKFVGMIKQVSDPAKLEQLIGMFSMQVESIEDEQEKDQMEQLIQIAKDHLITLKAAEGK